MSDSTNHVTAAVDAAAAMPDFQDTPEQSATRRALGEKTKRMILDPKVLNFVSRDVVEISWRPDGKTWQTQKLPIKSVQSEIIEQLEEEYRVYPVGVPRVWQEFGDGQGGQWIADQNTAEFLVYMQEVAVANSRKRKIKILHGLDFCLADHQSDEIVWDPDDIENCDIDRALKAFEAFQFPSSTLEEINLKIDLIAMRREADKQEAMRDLEGESAPLSVSHNASGNTGSGRQRRPGQRTSTR